VLLPVDEIARVFFCIDRHAEHEREPRRCPFRKPR
jgi:hypothetical protein